MVDVKMTNILVTTSQFLATLTYPVKNKVALPVSKKQMTMRESIDAIIEVSPIVHSATQLHAHLTEQFYEVLTQEASQVLTKNKEKALVEFLESCGEKVREELKQNAEEDALDLLEGEVNTVFINLHDAQGNLIQTKRRSVQDIVAALTHIRTKLMLWPTPKKLPGYLVQPSPVAPPKARRKERERPREGGMRRYMSGTAKKAA